VHGYAEWLRRLPHPQRYTAAPGDFVGGGLRSWLAVRCTRTSAHRPPGTHSLRSRHSRAAASAPASLPSLTVPRGYASVGRLAGSGASTLSVHGLFRNGPLDAGLTAAPSCGCYAGNQGPGAMRGVPRSGLWSEEWESPRSGVRDASGTGSERAEVASVAEGKPPRAMVPGFQSRCLKCRRTYQTMPATITAPISRSNLWKYPRKVGHCSPITIPIYASPRHQGRDPANV